VRMAVVLASWLAGDAHTGASSTSLTVMRLFFGWTAGHANMCHLSTTCCNVLQFQEVCILDAVYCDYKVIVF
jgi:hypothetical protein